MKSKSLYPLFIGFGKQAQEYAKVLFFKKIKIHSVCVKNLKNKEKIFNKYKIKNRFDNLEVALANKGYNSIFIFLPFNIIEKKILNILKMSNVPIYSEKPIALSYKKITKIEKFVKRNKKKLYILYNRNHYKIFEVIKKFTRREKFILRAYIPERINKTINTIDKKFKGNIRYHLTSHWLNFFFTIKKLKNIRPLFRKKDILFKSKTTEILISPNSKGYISAIFKSNKHVLFLLTLEQLFVFKIQKKRIKFLRYYNEFSQNQFKPGVERLIKFISNNKFKSNVSDVKVLYNSIKKLNY